MLVSKIILLMHMLVSELVENIPVCHENVYIVSFFTTFDFIIYDIVNIMCFFTLKLLVKIKRLLVYALNILNFERIII